MEGVAVEQVGQRTIAMRVTVPPLRRPKLWGLLGIIIVHVVLEIDRRLGGTLHAYLMFFYEYYRSCPFLTLPVGGLCVLLLWPRRWKLVTVKEVESEKSEEVASEKNTQPFPSAGGLGDG
jgi:hypothetical protein